jgi:hypothetical protein
MSARQPPFPNVDEFNNAYWIKASDLLTMQQLDLRYLRFPSAQGGENLQALNVAGVATFTNTVSFNNANAPTSLATIPAGDTTNKMPTTNWVSNEINGISTSNLSDTLLAGNSAGSSGIDMNNQSITNASNITTSTLNYTNINGPVDTRYLQFPNAQGTENLQSINVSGIATFNNNSAPTQPNTTDLLAGDNTTKIPTTAWVQGEISSGITGSVETVIITSASGTSLTPYFMPTNAYKYDIEVWGYGGEAGLSANDGVNFWAGGAGGSAPVVKAFGLSTSSNYQYYTSFPTTTWDAYWYNGTGPVNLIQVSKGGDGASAILGSGGAGGYAGTSVQINNDYITSSDVFIGTGGDSGGVSPLGSPIYPQGGFQPSSPNQGQGNYSVGDNGSGVARVAAIILTIYKN